MLKKLLLSLLAWLPALLWYSLIYWLSDQPQLPGTGNLTTDFVWFKSGHMVFYAILAAFVYWGVFFVWTRPEKNPHAVLFMSTLIAVSLAVLDEWHQLSVPGRQPHVRDVFIDAIGIGAMLLFLARYNLEIASLKRKILGM